MAHDYMNSEKVVLGSAGAAAGTTDVNFAGVDTDGFDSIECITVLGVLTATQVTSIHAEQSDDNGSADNWSDIEGSATTAMGDDDDNTIVRVEVSKPTKRFVRFVCDRGTENAVIQSAVYVLRSASERPITQDATVTRTKRVVAAPEGTP